MFRKTLKAFVFSTGRLLGLYLRFGKPSNKEYADYLRLHGRLRSIGKDCEFNLDVRILNPEYTRIGNNVCLSSCTLVGHDASISVLNRAFDKKLDSVGKIDIKDNVFVGINVTILPNVVVGSNSIIAAGSVVTKDVPPGSVVAGVPAKVIGSTYKLVEKLEQHTADLPWADLIYQRDGAYDESFEPKLKEMRVEYFFGDEKLRSK